MNTAGLRPTRPTIPLLPFIVGVVAMAYAGCTIAADDIAAGLHQAASPHVPAIGEAVPTAFGSITVLAVSTLDGLSQEQLAGMTHGVQNLVSADQVAVQVSFLIANTSDRPVRLDPAQFSLAFATTPDRRSWLGSTLTPGSLSPGSSLEASVMFAAPRDGQGVRVEYAAAHAPAITIATGQLDQGPAVSDGHTH